MTETMIETMVALPDEDASDRPPDRPADRPPNEAREASPRRLRWTTKWWTGEVRGASLAQTWRLSGEVVPERIPGGSLSRAARVWWVMNHTERVLLFALIMLVSLVPALLTAPLMWCAARPTRRVGLYVVVALLAVLLIVAG